ncbi:MAG: hypothetical protein ABIP95_04360 [Pelobium sp.]
MLSIALAIFIIYKGYHLTRKCLGGLMDESDLGLIKDIVNYLNSNRYEEWIDGEALIAAFKNLFKI